MGADYYLYSSSQRRVCELPRAMGAALWRAAGGGGLVDRAMLTQAGCEVPWAEDLAVLSDCGIDPEALPWIDGDAPGPLGVLREGWTVTVGQPTPEWCTEPFPHFGEIPGENEVQHTEPSLLGTRQSTGADAFHRAVAEIQAGRLPEGGVGVVGIRSDVVPGIAPGRSR